MRTATLTLLVPGPAGRIPMTSICFVPETEAWEHHAETLARVTTRARFDQWLNEIDGGRPDRYRESLEGDC